MSETGDRSGLVRQLDDATVKDKQGRVRGFAAVGPAGQAVLLRPGALELQASVERGVEVVGLKPGWKLASAAEFTRPRSRRSEPLVPSKSGE